MRENAMSIRRATAEDCEALTALMLRSRAYEGRYRKMIENYPITPKMVSGEGLWVAEKDGKLVGFYRLDLAKADLDLMFVDDTAQGSGIGREIFEHMKGFAAGKGLTGVQIVAHPPAADFYRKMGATDVGMSKAKVPDGWDRPILKLAIAQ